MSIDILFTSHNRKAFAATAFAELVANTDWSPVNRLFVADDHSSDGTREMLAAAIRSVPCGSTFTSARFGGSVAPLNWMLEQTSADLIAKIDSDVIVCPGWLEAMLDVMQRNADLDALGMEPGFASPPGSPPTRRGYKSAVHIGGVGLIRPRVFSRRRPMQSDRYFGLTAHWKRYAKCGWIDPDLPMFLLDHIPLEPWLSLTEEYIRNGWQRRWETYFTATPAHYDWWLKGRVAVA